MLRQSERLGERALLANAGSKSQQHLFAIAQRKSLSEAVTDVLVERGDRDVVHTVVKNPAPVFPMPAFACWCSDPPAMTTLRPRWACAATCRGRISSCSWRRLRSAVRARLAAENPHAGTAIEGVVAEVVGGIRNDARNASPDFAAAQAAVERQNRIRRIGEAEIYQYARDRKFEETAIALSLLCDTPIDVVERALLDPGAEIVLILAKVAGPVVDHDQGHPAAARRRPRHVGERPRQALSSFNRLQPETARPRARLLPHSRQKAGAADGAAGGCR